MFSLPTLPFDSRPQVCKVNFSSAYHRRLKLRYLDCIGDQYGNLRQIDVGKLTPRNKRIKLLPINAIKIPKSLQRLSKLSPRAV